MAESFEPRDLGTAKRTLLPSYFPKREKRAREWGNLRPAGLDEPGFGGFHRLLGESPGRRQRKHKPGPVKSMSADKRDQAQKRRASDVKYGVPLTCA